MFRPPSLNVQPNPAVRNRVKRTLRTILILILVFAIGTVLSIAVILAHNNGVAPMAPMQTPAPTPSPAPASASSLQLSLTVEKAVYSLGEPVNLTVTITNISNQTVSYTHTGLDFDFKVYNDSNNLVYQWSNFMAIPQFITIVPFPAGESMSQNFTWLQTCNFNTSVVGDQVSAGTYYIVGLTGPTYGLQTAPVQITIVQP